MLGRKGGITSRCFSVTKGTTGCGFFDPSGSTTCNIKQFENVLL
jgi:hypothetical protein